MVDLWASSEAWRNMARFKAVVTVSSTSSCSSRKTWCYRILLVIPNILLSVPKQLLPCGMYTVIFCPSVSFYASWIKSNAATTALKYPDDPLFTLSSCLEKYPTGCFHDPRCCTSTPSARCILSCRNSSNGLVKWWSLVVSDPKVILNLLMNWCCFPN